MLLCAFIWLKNHLKPHFFCFRLNNSTKREKRFGMEPENVYDNKSTMFTVLTDDPELEVKPKYD